MSNRAAEILLALNNQIKHAPPPKPSPFNNIPQESTPSPDKKKTKNNAQSELTS